MVSDKISRILYDFTTENYQKDYLNFLLNFSSNFRDASFVKFVIQIDEVYKKFNEILNKFECFLSDNLTSEEHYSIRIRRNLNLYTHILVRIYDLFKNIKESKLLEQVDSQITYYNYEKYFDNFKKFSKYDLFNFSNLVYEKPGWAYLDFKGNFIWADSTMQDMLFESKDLIGKNLFNDYMTEFSKFNIRKKENGMNFFDYKIEEKRNVNLKFTIDTRASRKEDSKSVSNLLYPSEMENKLFEHLNSVKTLKCNFSAAILQGQSENKTECAILMKAYLAQNRENFDDLVLINFNI